MNYLITGEPCVDIIHKANGETAHSYGGILYSVISMAVLSDDDDTITPIMNLGDDEYENIINIFRKYPKIKIHGINKVKHPTRKVNLYYDKYNADKSARVEKSTEPTRTLDYVQCESYFKMTDAILINMISGVDISLEILKKHQEKFQRLYPYRHS